MIKAIFFDVDGTLLNKQSKIEKSTEIAIKEAQEKGILCGIATGRGPSMIQDFFEHYQLDFAITYNGQYIYTKEGKVLSSKPFDKRTVQHIAKYADENNREILFGGSDFVSGSRLLQIGSTNFVRFLAPYLPKKISTGLKNSFQHGVRKLRKTNYSNYTALRKPIYQVVLVSPEKEQQKLETLFPSCTITRSNPYSVDMIPRGGSKFQGIQILCDYYGIPLDQTMAFGDSWNDLEMIQGVGHGVAMGNAVKALKEVADFITTANDKEGIARAFFQYGLTKKNASVHELQMEDLFVPTQEGVDNLLEISKEGYFTSKDEKFNQVKHFHATFDGMVTEIPTPLDAKSASFRVGFKAEELVELLWATSDNNKEVFAKGIENFKTDIDKAVHKIEQKKLSTNNVLVGQVDALVDLLYFTYGSFVRVGVDPDEIFDIVHRANMGKLGEDGQVHFDPVTHKILKPANWEEKFAPEKKIQQEIELQIKKRGELR